MNLLLPEAFGPAATETVAVVAAPTPPPPSDEDGDQGDEWGKSSPVALVVILLLAVSTILLIRSMSKRIRKLPETFEDRDQHGRIIENGSSRSD